LIAEGDDKGAIALSAKSNLICVLTAFIAWDDSQKVAVASHQLVQPSLELSDVRFCLAELAPMAAAAIGHVKARRSRGGLFDQLFSTRSAKEIAPLREPLPRAEQELERELADICERIGRTDWKPWLKTIHDWIAEATGAERLRRIEALDRLLQEIKIHSARIDGSHQEIERREKNKAGPLLQQQEQIEEAKRHIHQLLKSFVERLPAGK